MFAVTSTPLTGSGSSPPVRLKRRSRIAANSSNDRLRSRQSTKLAGDTSVGSIVW